VLKAKLLPPEVNSPSGAKLRMTLEYDSHGRRIRKQYFTPQGNGWNEQRDRIYLYDWWNLVGELDPNASNAKGGVLSSINACCLEGWSNPIARPEDKKSLVTTPPFINVSGGAW
jgi:hypothetical protein